ncbi:Transcription initiation factor TFIID subunit 8 [Rhynchospora pubera]|uniref:Transcription initiation factor TFIID subunit 8 n=1 Tax=Rhynchospora pubera TaxID=906938 RepID=A0AAV8D950_9POAL|nr:Transcription initiation factor TFIID subunit 8 [Rhynchospora pubera]
MSDGGEEDLGPYRNPRTSASIESSSTSSHCASASGPDEFGRAVSKAAVSQILQATGFDGFRKSAVDALSDLAIRYILSLGKATSSYANLAGRTSANLFDLAQGLEDLSNSVSGSKKCFVDSGVLTELNRFVKAGDPVPFSQFVPKFPICRAPKKTQTMDQIGDELMGKKHIPGWLPAFPAPHTYMHTPVWPDRKGDPREDKIEQVRQRRKAEKSLLNLQKRIFGSGVGGFVPVSTGTSNSGADKGKRVVGDNPFLAPPLPYGAKEVSAITPPIEADTGPLKRKSVLEAFGPTIEAANNTDLNADIGADSDSRDAISVKRPVVHFKLGVNKKSVALPLALDDNRDKLVFREDERDEKKRRAEMILKESMDNPQDLTQL